MIFSVVYLLARGLLGCLMVLARREVAKDAELLVLRHENAVLRRQTGRVRYQRADRLWLSALSRRRQLTPTTPSAQASIPTAWGSPAISPDPGKPGIRTG